MQIKCTNLSIGYNKHVVYQNINLDVNHKDFLLIIGNNGSGKSTLLKTILNLLPPINGSINRTVNYIGYMPQQDDIQKDFPATCLEVIMSGFINQKKLNPFYSKNEKETAISNMKKLNIEHLKNKSFNTLSGGQRQRVLLARALCATKEILILDEPTSNLDTAAKVEFYNQLKVLNKEISIILISHEIDVVLPLATQILDLDYSSNMLDINQYLKEKINV